MLGLIERNRLLAYSMGFLPQKTQLAWNCSNVPLSCRAWKVVYTVKFSAWTNAPSWRYASHKFCCKIENFEKMKKFWKFSNVVVMTFSTLHGPKLNLITYSCSPKCGAFSHIWMIIFRCSNNSYFCVILEPMITMGVFTLSPQKLKMATFHCLVSYYIL